MIGSALSNNLYESDRDKILNHKFQYWVEVRNKIARVAISPLSESRSLTPRTEERLRIELKTDASSSEGSSQYRSYKKMRSDPAASIMTTHCLTHQNSTFVLEEAIQILLENHFNNFLRHLSDISDNTIFEQIPRADLIGYYCRSISVLLPLIILQQDNNQISNLYAKTIAKYNSNFALIESIQQDVAAWNYIVTLALNNQFPFEEANVSLAIERILSGIKAKPSSLVEKLNMVSHAWKHGWSLKQLTIELYRHENLTKETIPTASLVIALSFYCFASTPRNFMLSVKRATKIDCNLSMPVALLTATVSGAYNGKTNIPKNWLRPASDCQPYQLAQKTVKKLYRNWLGIYDLDNLELLCNLDVNKVATPGIFQTRQNLNIVSQNFNSD